MVSIYALADPRSKGIRYIGRTDRPLRARRAAHLKEARGHWGNWKAPLYQWIRALLGKGIAPSIVLLAKVPDADGAEAENDAILQHRKAGASLLNRRVPGEWRPSKAARRKMRLAKLGKKASAATRRRMARAGKATWKDPSIRAKRIAGLMGHTYSAASLRRMSLAAKGRVIPPAQRRKISKSLTGLKQSPETRAKRSASLLRFHARRKDSI